LAIPAMPIFSSVVDKPLAACPIVPITAASLTNPPTWPVRVVVGFSPGGVSDLSARLVSISMNDETKVLQTFKQWQSNVGSAETETSLTTSTPTVTLQMQIRGESLLPASRREGGNDGFHA
jgi:tripartite-type tricarboxylate transporter receptor subunit TctC